VGAEIIFEDDDIVVVDKPSGTAVHASPGHESGSLADHLARSRRQMLGVGSVSRPGVVHRLDIETSGVMVFAKTKDAYAALRRDFEAHTAVKKTYLAVLHGSPRPPAGELKTLIGRKPWDAKRMAVVESSGQEAITSWQVLQRQGPIALVEFKIETGRTHQIRVHAAHLGHPIVGDALYGDAAKDRRLRMKPRRMLLHAVELAFPHPRTRRQVVFAAMPPADIVYAG
jgi:23S rRNA pseudouridine1911/1915/1917 synthase